MTSLSNFIYFFVIIFSITKVSSAKEEIQWTTHRLISKDGWSLKDEHFDNPIFVYALCKDKGLPNSKRECTIILDEDIYGNDAIPKQCLFTLENASNGIIHVKSFGSDRAIFVSNDETTKNGSLQWTFNTGVIQMSSCQIVDTGLVLSTKKSGYNDKSWYSFHSNILVYENTFDVMVQGVQACGDAIDANHCVYTYNSDGKKIGGPVTRFSPYCDEVSYEFQQILRRSSDKGYLLLTGPKTRQISIIKPTESNEVITKLVHKFPSFVNQKGHSISFYSRANEMIGMCSCQVFSDRLACNCLQFDQQGDSKRQIDIALKNPSDSSFLYWVFIHNLPGGGFLFMPLYTDSEKHFYSLYKVDSVGRITGGPLEVGEHSHACNPEFVNTRFIEIDDGQYCVTLRCVEEYRQEKVLKTLTKCFTSSSWK